MNDDLPVNCSFYDYLEHFCIRKEKVTLIYRELDEIKPLENQVIFDLSGGSKGEYIHIKPNGIEQLIRMDQLISVGDIRLSDFESASCGV